jgi:sugar lactone lactonase YvrE
VVLRRTEEELEATREETVPPVMATALGARTAQVFGEGWLFEPRGLAVSSDGQLAVADVILNEVLFFNEKLEAEGGGLPEPLKQPEAVAWTPDGVLVIADTWNHRVLLYDRSSNKMRPLPDPPDGWYGPRAVAVAEDGTVAVADTGHKRVILLSGGGNAPRIESLGGEGNQPGQLVEPVGVTWLDRQRLLVCDTGNRRLQVLDRSGRALEVVPLPDAWTDFYSRPQILALAEDHWLATDVPAKSLWSVKGGVPTKIDLGEDGIVPSGLARYGETLFVSDLGSKVWAFELPEDE